MLQTGWVRLKVTPDRAAKHAIAVGPGQAVPVYFQSEVMPWSVDPEAGIDTLISVVNRNNNGDDDEIEIETVWWDGHRVKLNTVRADCYYTEQVLLRASECIVPGYTPPESD